MRFGITARPQAAEGIVTGVRLRAGKAHDAALEAAAETAAAEIRAQAGKPGDGARPRKVGQGWVVPWAGIIDRWLDAGTRQRRTRRGLRRGRIRARRFYRRATDGAAGRIDAAVERAARRNLPRGD